MKEITSIPVASRTFEALRNLGYDLNSSIADVVDNSITEKVAAKNVSIFLGFKEDSEIICTIQDDGCGMSEKELEEAMRLGTETSYGASDLGKFGMGMKTASLSQCNILTVISKKRRGEISGYQWNIDHVRDNGWVLLKLNKSEISAILQSSNIEIKSQGTTVIWNELFWLTAEYNSYKVETMAENFLYRMVDRLKLHLGMVFHRFLDGTVGKNDSVNIIVNGDQVLPWDPFCREEKNTQKVVLKKELSELKMPETRAPIYIEGYVLPNKESFSSEEAWKNAKGLLSWNDSQGYYIYRANRIIRFGGWQGTKVKDEHDKLARISIDIDPSLDRLFRITVNKARIELPELLFHHLKHKINNEVIRKAKAKYNKSEEKLSVQNNFRKNGRRIAEISKELLSDNNIKTQKAGQSDNSGVQVQNPSGTWLSNKVNEFLKYGSDKDYEIISDRLDDNKLWKIVCNDQDKFKVIVNASHPFYNRIYTPTTNKATTDAIDALIFSLAFAELYNKNNQNAHLFDTFKVVCAKALERLTKDEVI